MMKAIMPVAFCLALTLGSVAEAQQRRAITPAQNRLIARYNAAHIACRGGPGDEPETMEACGRRDEIERRMTEDFNLCFGWRGWQPCARPQARRR